MASARWVLFRLLFGAGIVKLLGGDPSWWDCSATSWVDRAERHLTPWMRGGWVARPGARACRA